MQKSLTKADSAGFCFGVSRAVEMVSDLLEQGKKVCTLGPIIHNMEMVEELRQKGCRPVDSVDELAEDEIKLDKNKKHDIDIVVDRLVVKEGIEKRGVNRESATQHFQCNVSRAIWSVPLRECHNANDRRARRGKPAGRHSPVGRWRGRDARSHEARGPGGGRRARGAPNRHLYALKDRGNLVLLQHYRR